MQVALRFKPCDLNPAELRLSCIFNHSASNSSTVLLSGTASEPRLVWDVPDNRLFYRPTCVGASSQRQLTVRNASKVPVGWQWVLSKKLQDAVTITPMVSLLDDCGNGSRYVGQALWQAAPTGHISMPHLPLTCHFCPFLAGMCYCMSQHYVWVDVVVHEVCYACLAVSTPNTSCLGLVPCCAAMSFREAC